MSGIVTRGLGSNTVITRGYGFSGLITRLKEVFRRGSQLTKLIILRSKLWK